MLPQSIGPSEVISYGFLTIRELKLTLERDHNLNDKNKSFATQLNFTVKLAT